MMRSRSPLPPDGDSGEDDGLARAASGDMQAFAEFYDLHSEAVLRYFQARTASPDTAADLTAETFAAALASLTRFRPSEGPGGAWLFGIARHQLSRYHRWRSVDARARSRLGMVTEVSLDEESFRRIEDLVDHIEIAKQLHGALDGLSRRLADAVRLRIVDELPYPEVAKRLACSESAARARVSRGLRKLSADMEVTI